MGLGERTKDDDGLAGRDFRECFSQASAHLKTQRFAALKSLILETLT